MIKKKNFFFERMETKMEANSKSNISNMEQKELSKSRNDEITVIKPSDIGGAVVTLSKGHYQIMIIQYLLDENTYMQLDSCIDNKIQSKLLRFQRQY